MFPELVDVDFAGVLRLAPIVNRHGEMDLLLKEMKDIHLRPTVINASFSPSNASTLSPTTFEGRRSTDKSAEEAEVRRSLDGRPIEEEVANAFVSTVDENQNGELQLEDWTGVDETEALASVEASVDDLVYSISTTSTMTAALSDSTNTSRHSPDTAIHNASLGNCDQQANEPTSCPEQEPKQE